jgi:hypothetical protein
VRLSDEVLDQIDAIVAPGADIIPLEAAYKTPAITTAGLRRRPVVDRAAA